MDDDYLKKDFDIGKLTIPKIKKILIENGITEFPTRVKKDQLIEIFNKNIDLIRKKKREEKKKEESRSNNIYQEGRSSIIELEVNKKDGEGGEYTSGRPKGKDVKGKDDESKDVERKIEDKSDIKGTKQFINTISTSNPSPQNHSPPPIPNSSFLDSLTAHLKSTSKRRKSLEDVNKDKKDRDKKDREKKNNKKVIVEVDSGVSDTTFFNLENNEGINKGSKVVVSSTKTPINPYPPTNPYPYLPKYLLILLLPLFLIPFYFLLPYCTNGDFICLPVPLNGKIVNKKLVCDKGFILKKSFFREKCIKDSKEIRMLKRINLIINELEILKGDYKLGLVKDYKRNVWDVLEGGGEGYRGKGDYKEDYKDKGQGDTTKHKNHNIFFSELLQILKHSPKVKIHNDLIYSIKYKITLKSFIRHLKSFIRNYSLKAFYFLLLILFIILIFYNFYKRRQGLLEKKNQSQKIVKEILNILLRQLIISSKNTRFPGFVYVDHLKDVFLLEKKLWEMVKENVEKNSNVKKGKNEEKETWEWVGPYVENPIM